MGISRGRSVSSAAKSASTTITDEGQAALAEARAKIVELTHEVVEGHGPAKLPEPSADDEEEGID